MTPPADNLPIITAAQTTTLPVPAQQALELYRTRLAHHGDERPITVAWAPGRVNLIGEHTDYNDGFVLPVAIDRVVAIAGRSHDQRTIRCYSLHHHQFANFTPAPNLPATELPLWARYVRGVLEELMTSPTGSSTPAFSAAIAGDVPVGGGLSSSAALEVAVTTFVAALGGPALTPMAAAQLCQRAEHVSTGVRVGIMDQAVSCLGRAGHALLLDCRSLAYQYVPVELPDVVLAVYDTRVPHSLAGSAYNERRQQCEEAVDILATAITARQPERDIRALRDVTAEDLARYGERLPTVLRRRAQHVISENARVLAAVQALRAGQAAVLGDLLYASHASLRDNYEVSCRELDAVVEIARSVPGVLGARLIGAGFGGSALVLVRREGLDRLEAALAEQYPQRTGRRGAIHVCQVAGGPGASAIQP